MSTLRDFLQWEVPQKAYGSPEKEPLIYLSRKKEKDGTFSGYRLLLNHAFIKEALPEMVPMSKKDALGNMAVFVDRNKDTKVKYAQFVLNVPDDMPRYRLRRSSESSASMQITNKMLLEELWEDIFRFPPNVPKQYLTCEKDEVVEGKQVYKLTYNPRLARNSQIIATNKQNKK